MDSALRDILREEKKRHHNNGHNNREHSKHKSKDKHSKDKHKSHRRHKSENDSKSIEFVDVPDSVRAQVQSQGQTNAKIHDNTDDRIILMFLYEDADGKLHRKLESIPTGEGKEAKIFPVYVHGSHDNFTEEEIIYKGGKWTSSMEGTWLEWMNNKEYNLLPFDGDDVVVYNGKLFHCEGDMLEYLGEFGPEVLKVE